MGGKRILTNRFNLPETLVSAVKYDSHRVATGANISVTTLIDGPQIRYLKSMYDYEVDIMDSMYALLGTALHHILERANIQNHRQRAFMLTADYLQDMAKEYVTIDADKSLALDRGAKWLLQLIPIFFPDTQQQYIFEQMMTLDIGDYIISGTFDLYDKKNDILYDYKVCSTYQWTMMDQRRKWDEQLNIYAHMLRAKGFTPKEIRVVAFFRDWQRGKSATTRDYPNSQVRELYVPLWEPDQVREIINHHADLHREMEKGNVAPCNGRVRWASADSFAVMKYNSRRAVKLFDNRASCEEYIKLNFHKHGEQLYVQDRPGVSNRCANFCPMNKVCPQYAAELKRLQEIEF